LVFRWFSLSVYLFVLKHLFAGFWILCGLTISTVVKDGVYLVVSLLPFCRCLISFVIGCIVAEEGIMEKGKHGL
jgi:hypothetical protein